MLKDMIGYSVNLIFLLLPLNIFSMNFETNCDLLKLPRECHCQRSNRRHIPIDSLNDTRLRCRQLTDITTNQQWSKVSYDRLSFETSNDNLTLHPFVFADVIVRTLRFDAQNLFLQDHAFDNAYIGQLSISHHDIHGGINFELDSQIFSGTTITNLYFKSIDFQNPISGLIFSNAKIYIFLIQSSKFYGFVNNKLVLLSKSMTKMKYDYFLEYEYLNPTNQKKIQSYDENSYIELEQTVIMNITSMTYPIYIKIYTIISSINTTNLTENYFPNNLEYSQLEEIELSCNQINSLDAHVFRHLKQFKGRLILKNNQIKYIDLYAFENLSLLKNLSLKQNFIQNLSSEHFQDLKELDELDLSSNQIHQLDNNIFEYLYNLKTLYLNYNPLEFIHENTFSNLTKLKQIHFQGVQFIHLIDQQYFQWIWNLASLHVIDLLKTDFELSDVAFCMLSRYNQTLFHFSRQHSCSCNTHYFNLNQNLTENISISKYQTNYLRLTPICHENNTNSTLEEQINENDLILQDLENKCDYKLMFIDCDAMTTTTVQTTPLQTTPVQTTTLQTTTVQTTTLSEIEKETTSDSSIIIELTTETSIPKTSLKSTENEITFNSSIIIQLTTKVPIPKTTLRSIENEITFNSSIIIQLTTKDPIPKTTLRRINEILKTKNPLKNIKKLFVVLATLIAITIGAIIVVFLWHRFKKILKRRKKQKCFVEQPRHFNSPVLNNHQSTAPHSASSNMSGSTSSAHLSTSKNPSQTLIEPPTSNMKTNSDNPTESFIDNEILKKNSMDKKPKKL